MSLAMTAEAVARIRKLMHAKKPVEIKTEQVVACAERAAAELWRILNVFEVAQLFTETYFAKFDSEVTERRRSHFVAFVETSTSGGETRSETSTSSGEASSLKASSDGHWRERVKDVEQQLFESQRLVQELESRLHQITSVDEDLLSRFRFDLQIPCCGKRRSSESQFAFQ